MHLIQTLLCREYPDLLNKHVQVLLGQRVKGIHPGNLRATVLHFYHSQVLPSSQVDFALLLVSAPESCVWFLTDEELSKVWNKEFMFSAPLMNTNFSYLLIVLDLNHPIQIMSRERASTTQVIL